jgi:periplasmic protein TonB
VNAPFDQPTIPTGLRRPLAAVWISFALHAALIALVQVATPGASGTGESVIEARLEQVEVAPPAEPASTAALLAPSEAESALPVSEPESSPAASPAVPETPVNAPAEAPSPPAGALTSLVDLAYYSPREVDVLPRALQEIVPGYPDDAERAARSGKVRLQLKLEADGRVIDVEVVDADPPGLFDEAARAAFATARFSPAYRGGKPVRVQMVIEVVFDWQGRDRHSR